MSNNNANLTNINIKIITTESNLLINLGLIRIYINDEITSQILYQEDTLIKYKFNNYNTIPNYFFTTYYANPENLVTNNFNITLPNGFYYNYVVSETKTLPITYNYTMYITTKFVNIPITFLGSINSLNTITTRTLINYDNINYNNINNVPYNFSFYNITTFLNFSFIKNTVLIPGKALLIKKVESTTTKNGFTKLYSNYSNYTNVLINNLLKIYNYNNLDYRIDNIILKDNTLNNLLPSINVQVINCMIEIFNNNKSYYKHIVNLNYDLIDNDKNYNIVIFFKNFIKNYTNLTGIKLYVFDYDYKKYFINLNSNDYYNLPPIKAEDANLYDILIKYNINLIKPEIPNININNYNLNLNKIMIINNLFLNKNLNVISEFLKSGSITIDLLADYLSNFNIKPYNFWKITTNYSNNNVLNSDNFLLNTMLLNINIIYKNTNTTDNLSYYRLYTELFNNNNRIDLYHKNYNLEGDNKKKLIKDFIIIILNYCKINIYFYNNLLTLNNSINNKLYIKFNNINLQKSDTNIRFNFDQFYNLNLTIDLSVSYKILIFKSSNNNNLDSILNFKTSTYKFQIFNIPQINGNIDNINNVYYIAFSNIYECNEFINFITTGILHVNDNEVKSYFNITRSLNFKKNLLTDYYELTSELVNVINFSILNLDLTTTSIFTNNKINLL